MRLLLVILRERHQGWLVALSVTHEVATQLLQECRQPVEQCLYWHQVPEQRRFELDVTDPDGGQRKSERYSEATESESAAGSNEDPKQNFCGMLGRYGGSPDQTEEAMGNGAEATRAQKAHSRGRGDRTNR